MEGVSRCDEWPGAEWIAQGLEDLQHNRQTISALLVSIGAPRLQRAGLSVPPPLPSPEQRLYELLSQETQDAAHSRYNALIHRLVSFERAAECVKAWTI